MRPPSTPPTKPEDINTKRKLLDFSPTGQSTARSSPPKKDTSRSNTGRVAQRLQSLEILEDGDDPKEREPWINRAENTEVDVGDETDVVDSEEEKRIHAMYAKLNKKA